MQRVLIVGAGGHAQVVADILLLLAASGDWIPVGYLDDNPELRDRSLLGLPVLGPLYERSAFPHDALVIAVGRNDLRQRLYGMLRAEGAHFATLVHPRATIAHDVVIGPGSVICAGAVIGPGARLGCNVIINTAATVDHHNRIGDHCHIAPGAHLGGDVQIGDGCLVGLGALIMPQRSVGAWSIVGAGALVHRSLPSGVTAVGTPARVIREH